MTNRRLFIYLTRRGCPRESKLAALGSGGIVNVAENSSTSPSFRHHPPRPYCSSPAQRVVTSKCAARILGEYFRRCVLKRRGETFSPAIFIPGSLCVRPVNSTLPETHPRIHAPERAWQHLRCGHSHHLRRSVLLVSEEQE